MAARGEVIEGLDEFGALAGFRWAYSSAADRTLEQYSEADGHDEGWFGTTRFVLFRDRLDRVFGCGRYLVRPNSDPTLSADLLHAELSERDIATMPQVRSGLMWRSNLNGSPGWAWSEGRLLIASCAVGQIDVLPWPQKSPTKQMVARQPSIDPAQVSLFEDDDEFGGLIEILTRSQPLDLPTYVVAHTLDSVSHQQELVLGSPRLNSGGGSAWNWSEDLLKLSPAGGGSRVRPPSTLTVPDDEPPAPVRLRRPEAKPQDGQADAT